MIQLNLFVDIVELIESKPEPIIEIPQTAKKFKKRIIGDNFIVVKCLRCSQMIMVDPEYYEHDAYQDKICEACNEKYANKYLKYLKMRL